MCLFVLFYLFFNNNIIQYNNSCNTCLYSIDCVKSYVLGFIIVKVSNQKSPKIRAKFFGDNFYSFQIISICFMFIKFKTQKCVCQTSLLLVYLFRISFKCLYSQFAIMQFEKATLMEITTPTPHHSLLQHDKIQKIISKRQLTQDK